MKTKRKNEDGRLEAISDLLIQYSLGNFDAHLPISDNEDDIDAIIAGVNMLGEELKDVTISRDFLVNIYNSIAEMLFIADLSGVIQDANQVACKKLGVSKFDLLNRNLFDFILINGKLPLDLKNKTRISAVDKTVLNGQMRLNPNIKLKCSFTTLRESGSEPTGILLIAEDITDRIATEKLIIRTIVETQEKERNRFASDLHDSLGQQLSGIRFYLSALQNNMIGNDKFVQQFNKTLQSIDGAIVELRNICFNLMPRTLENHTLKYSLNELTGKYSIGDELKVQLKYGNEVPILSKQFEIACFRIVQEFLNNAIKHGKASKVLIHISMRAKTKELKIQLEDNGVGLDVGALQNRTGMGLRNIQTRVESYYGSLEFDTTIDKGTKMTMYFPIAFVTLPT
jgi:PAS domain S-box-containing protein